MLSSRVSYLLSSALPGRQTPVKATKCHNQTRWRKKARYLPPTQLMKFPTVDSEPGFKLPALSACSSTPGKGQRSFSMGFGADDRAKGHCQHLWSLPDLLHHQSPLRAVFFEHFMDWQHSSIFAAPRRRRERSHFRCRLLSGLDLERCLPRRLRHDDDQHRDAILADHACPRHLRWHRLRLSLRSERSHRHHLLFDEEGICNWYCRGWQ